MGHRGNDLLLPRFATRRLQQRQQPLPFSLSSLYTVSLSIIATTIIIQPTLIISIKFALGHIYTNMTFGLFTNIALVGSLKHICIYVPSIRGEVLTRPTTSGSSHFPSGGTCFLTNSPFTPAWDVVLVRSASDMHPDCRVSVLWSAYLTRSRSCGSSSVRTLDLLLAPGSSDTYVGCASSWNGTLRS